jgi:NAD-dependent deacetylase
VKPGIPVYVVDPKIPKVNLPKNVVRIEEKASIGVPKLVKELIESE